MSREFRLVTHKNWMVDEFRGELDGEDRIGEIVHDYGFDITHEGVPTTKYGGLQEGLLPLPS